MQHARRQQVYTYRHEKAKPLLISAVGDEYPTAQRVVPRKPGDGGIERHLYQIHCLFHVSNQAFDIAFGV